ncbi:hypothetical protein JOD24_000200 [Kroppenstedtia sanguinis]|uniref:hypothetical protein n=1 Tax=Kroppenstedtia sanguinis TaxID=1380684 RepID=UPI003D22041E
MIGRISVFLFLFALVLTPLSVPVSASDQTLSETDVQDAKADSIGTKANCSTNSRGWLNDPLCAKNRSTVYKNKNVELRIGYWKGKQYGWARLIKGNTVDFQVDLNGDRRVDIGSMVINAKPGNYTKAYPASSSSKVAFRACGGKPVTCTPWW